MGDSTNYLDELRSRPCPPHPGEYVREEVIPALQLSIPELARKIGLPESYLEKLANEQESITPEAAIALSTQGGDPMLWMDLQSSYDLWHAIQLVPATPAAAVATRPVDPVAGAASPDKKLG